MFAHFYAYFTEDCLWWLWWAKINKDLLCQGTSRTQTTLNVLLLVPSLWISASLHPSQLHRVEVGASIRVCRRPRAPWIKNRANRALAAGVIEELWAGRGQRWDSRYFLPTNLPYVLKSVWNGYVFPRPGSLWTTDKHPSFPARSRAAVKLLAVIGSGGFFAVKKFYEIQSSQALSVGLNFLTPLYFPEKLAENLSITYKPKKETRTGYHIWSHFPKSLLSFNII